MHTLCQHVFMVCARVIAPKLGQIGPKWDKYGTLYNSVVSTLICSIWVQFEPAWGQLYVSWLVIAMNDQHIYSLIC